MSIFSPGICIRDMWNADAAKRLRRPHEFGRFRAFLNNDTIAQLSPSRPAGRLACAASAIKVEPGTGWNKCVSCDIVQAAGWGAAARMTVYGLEARGSMRTTLFAIAGFAFLSATPALAKIDITVDKNNQIMTVAVDGVERYRWPVSTGIPSRETPNGTFRA
ncbi:MAG: L,D-transpeptidase, partial [Bradyrhizobium sp.]|nr:L,D-transpeptidase [Bradyrhizobium sp.]